MARMPGYGKLPNHRPDRVRVPHGLPDGGLRRVNQMLRRQIRELEDAVAAIPGEGGFSNELFNAYFGSLSNVEVIRAQPDGTQAVFVEAPQAYRNAVTFGDKVYAVLADGRIRRYGPTGSVEWTSDVDSPLTPTFASAVNVDGIVAIGRPSSGDPYRFYDGVSTAPVAEALSERAVLDGGLAFDSSGHLYAAQFVDEQVSKFAPDGSVIWRKTFSEPRGVVGAPGGGVFLRHNPTSGPVVSQISPDGDLVAGPTAAPEGDDQTLQPLLDSDTFGGCYLPGVGLVTKMSVDSGVFAEEWTAPLVGSESSRAGGVSVAPSGVVYVTSRADGRLHIINSDGEHVTSTASPWTSAHRIAAVPGQAGAGLWPS